MAKLKGKNYPKQHKFLIIDKYLLISPKVNLSLCMYNKKKYLLNCSKRILSERMVLQEL